MHFVHTEDTPRTFIDFLSLILNMHLSAIQYELTLL